MTFHKNVFLDVNTDWMLYFRRLDIIGTTGAQNGMVSVPGLVPSLDNLNLSGSF